MLGTEPRALGMLDARQATPPNHKYEINYNNVKSKVLQM